jgi:hypothetical protein
MVKKVLGVIQSNYLPWQGYFDFIKSCDYFVIFDDVQYTTFDWRNRNKIKVNDSFKWITVPVHFSRSSCTTIEKTPINYDVPWIEEQKKWLKLGYSKAKFFDHFFDQFCQILNQKPITISQLNVALIKWLLDILKIKTPIYMSSELPVDGERTEKFINLLKHFNAQVYLSGPSAKSYLDYDLFKKKNLELRFKSYKYPEYRQLGDVFIPGLSILDLIFNVGSDSSNLIKSVEEDEIFL